MLVHNDLLVITYTVKKLVTKKVFDVSYFQPCRLSEKSSFSYLNGVDFRNLSNFTLGVKIMKHSTTFFFVLENEHGLKFCLYSILFVSMHCFLGFVLS